ncbi:MAG TPA: NAD(P)-dependent oxidoreductase [bacterium]|nr:NAD(P)-dependent oxidoreductase [bacterium]
MEKCRVKIASSGLSAGGALAAMLGDEFLVEEFSPEVPLRDQVATAQVLLVRSVPVTREVIDAAPHLRLIQRPGANVEAVDMAYATEKGIPVCNIPRDLLWEPYVAEHAMFLILALAKRYRETQESLRARRSGQPLTLGLRGKTLGLIGVGRTGTPLVRMARAFEMNVRAVKRMVDERIRDELGLTWLQPFDRLPELLRESDFVSIHLPLLKETTGFVGTREIGLMKPTAFLINISRGSIVDKTALLTALQEGRLAGAGVDVFWEEPPDPEDPLLQCPTVIATPHVAGFTKEGLETLARHSAENIRRVMSGLPARYALNGL